jgi:hypothetical protein
MWKAVNLRTGQILKLTAECDILVGTKLHHGKREKTIMITSTTGKINTF